MLFTWDTTNLCIIFPSWHIRGTVSLTLSIVAIVLITAFYEFIRDFARKYEAQIYEQSKGLPSTLSQRDRGSTRFRLRCVDDELSSLVPMSGSSAVKISKQAHAAKALLYAAQVFYSFSIMYVQSDAESG